MIPWTVLYAKAALDAGRRVPSWLELSVDMAFNQGGCASCVSVKKSRRDDAEA